MNSLKKRKIIWAFDPTHNPKDAKNIIAELTIWSEKLDCDVQPVCVFSRSLFNFPDVTLPWDKKYEDLAEKSVSNYLKVAKAKDFLQPELIFVNTFSHRSMAAELAQYADKHKATMIFANTHARKTNALVRIGGFTESLVATSRVPVLLLTPKAKASRQISPVLFPTDFSRESQNALLRLQLWVKEFNAKLILYNQIEQPTTFALGPIGLSLVEHDWKKMLPDLKKARSQKATKLNNKLQEEGISSSFVMRIQNKSLDVEILEMAKKSKAGLIAMATQRGPIGQIILGSIARDVLLQANCPVIVFNHPRQMRKSVAPFKLVHYEKPRRRLEVPLYAKPLSKS